MGFCEGPAPPPALGATPARRGWLWKSPGKVTLCPVAMVRQAGGYLKKVKATAREAPAAVASTYLLAVHPFTELVGPASGALLPASEVPSEIMPASPAEITGAPESVPPHESAAPVNAISIHRFIMRSSCSRAPTAPAIMARRVLLEQALHDRAVDDDPCRPERFAARSREKAAAGEAQDLELLVYARAVALGDGVGRPYAEVDVPDRAVVGGDGGDAAEHIERAVAVGDRAVQALPLWIHLARAQVLRSVRDGEQALDGAEHAVVAAYHDVGDTQRETCAPTHSP